MLITQLAPAPKPLDVTFANGAKLPITYDRTALTVPLLAAVNKAQDSNDPTLLLTMVCRLVKTWDLADDKGEIPVGPEHEAEVGDRVNADVLGTVLGAINEDIGLDPTNVRSSTSS